MFAFSNVCMQYVNLLIFFTSLHKTSANKIGIYKTANSANRPSFKFRSLSRKHETVHGLWAITL